MKKFQINYMKGYFKKISENDAAYEIGYYIPSIEFIESYKFFYHDCKENFKNIFTILSNLVNTSSSMFLTDKDISELYSEIINQPICGILIYLRKNIDSIEIKVALDFVAVKKIRASEI